MNQGILAGLPMPTAIPVDGMRSGFGQASLPVQGLQGFPDPDPTLQLYEAIALANPGANSGVTGWTNEIGSIGQRTASPSPFEGAGYFFGNANPETLSRADVAIPSKHWLAIDRGQRYLRLQWRQAGFGTSDFDRGGCEYAFLDQSGNFVQTRTAFGSSQSQYQTWNLREYRNILIPFGTRTVRVYYHSLRTSGSNCDVYIDLIEPHILTPILRWELPLINGSFSEYLNGWRADSTTPAALLVWQNGLGQDGTRGYIGGDGSVDIRWLQDIVIPPAHYSKIDQGLMQGGVTWYQQGINDVQSGEMAMQPFDAAGTSLLARQDAGLMTFDAAAWYPREQYMDLPVGTRVLRVLIHTNKLSGSFTNVFFDSVRAWIYVKPVLST